MNANLTSDIQSAVDRLRAIYVTLVDCADSSVACATIPAILSFPFASNAGHLYRNVTRLNLIHSAFWELLDDVAIRIALRIGEECSDDETPSTDVGICRMLSIISASELLMPQANALSNDAWLNQIIAGITYLESLFSCGNPCPRICAPCGCPPCGLAEEYTVLAGATNAGSVGMTIWETLEDIVMTRDELGCSWSGQGRVEIDGIEYNDVVVEVGLDALNCRWSFVCEGHDGIKLTGQTPAGSYVPIDDDPSTPQVYATIIEAT